MHQGTEIQRHQEGNQTRAKRHQYEEQWNRPQGLMESHHGHPAFWGVGGFFEAYCISCITALKEKQKKKKIGGEIKTA